MQGELLAFTVFEFRLFLIGPIFVVGAGGFGLCLWTVQPLLSLARRAGAPRRRFISSLLCVTLMLATVDHGFRHGLVLLTGAKVAVFDVAVLLASIVYAWRHGRRLLYATLPSHASRERRLLTLSISFGIFASFSAAVAASDLVFYGLLRGSEPPRGALLVLLLAGAVSALSRHLYQVAIGASVAGTTHAPAA